MLGDPGSKASLLLYLMPKLNLTRTRQRAFHPNGEHRVLMVSPNVFVVCRTSPEGDQHIVAITNVTSRAISIKIPISELEVHDTVWWDLIGEREWKAKDGTILIPLEPYDVVWLTPKRETR